MENTNRIAPELEVESWLNTKGESITLEGLRGKVVVVEAFQMLCPGCVTHGLPMLSRIADTFAPYEVVTLGLHTVFEHHGVQGSRAFIHEYRINYPVGIDAADPAGTIPRTMNAYGLRGTPSLVVIDQAGIQRAQSFGAVSDLAVGALLGQLLHNAPARDESPSSSLACTDDGCAIR